MYAHKLTWIPIKSLALKAMDSKQNKFLVNPVGLDRHGLRPSDDVIASHLAFSREHGVAGGNPELSIFKQRAVGCEATEYIQTL